MVDILHQHYHTVHLLRSNCLDPYDICFPIETRDIVQVAESEVVRSEDR